MKIIMTRFIHILLILVSLLFSQTSFSYPGRKENPQFPEGPPRQNPRETIGAGSRLIEYPSKDNNIPIPAPPQIDSPIRSGSETETCFPKDQPPLITLAPHNHLITTTSANLSLWFFVNNNNKMSAELIVIDQQGKILGSHNFNLLQNSGVIQINLPSTVSLQVNQTYSWEVALICDPVDRSKDKYVEGQIKRIQLSQQQQDKLQEIIDPLEKARFYAKSELWDETLNSVAQLRPTLPEAWEDLLASVGLEKINSEPFLDCCKLEK